jgi:hypothetical protein
MPGRTCCGTDIALASGVSPRLWCRPDSEPETNARGPSIRQTPEVAARKSDSATSRPDRQPQPDDHAHWKSLAPQAGDIDDLAG